MNSFSLNLMAGLALCLFALPASALEFVVNNFQDVPDASPGDGQCNPINAIPGTCTLRAAIMEANAHPGSHTILLPSGTYMLSNTGIGENAAVTGDLDIHRDITIINGTNNPPVVDGNYQDRLFYVHTDGKLTLVNTHLFRGMANVPGTVHGGAVRVDAGAVLHLRRAVVSTNIGNIGGAIYSDGEVIIEDSDFFNNVLKDDTVQPNFADGTAVLSRGTLLITRSTFRSNGLMPGGEGQFLTGRYAVRALVGFVDNPVVLITHSTFSDNTNGIFSEGVQTYIMSATLVANNQRGIRFLPNLDALGQTQLAVVSTVLFGHTGDCNQIPHDQPEYSVSGNSNASSDESCGFTGTNDYQNISYPFLGELGEHGGPTMTFMPRSNGILVDPPGSSCSFLGAPEDQRGVDRPQDGNLDGTARCDIGAVEFNPATDPVLTDALFGDRFEG